MQRVVRRFFGLCCHDPHRLWPATEPLDMRAGPDTTLARVVVVSGAIRRRCAYLFAKRRGNRMKVLIRDGLGIWLCARRLNKPSPTGPAMNTATEGDCCQSK